MTFIDKKCQVSCTVVLIANDDDEAKRRAKAMVDGHSINLWNGLRLIEHFPPVDPPK